MKLEVSHQVRSAREMLGVNWANVLFLSSMHVAAVAALFFTSWAAVITGVVLYWVAGSLGIGMAYHRLLTHRGYKVPKLVEYFLATCGTLALEGGPIEWVVTHRIHHAHADQPGDPHTPREGGWWAHIGWILWGTAQNHDQATIARYAPDLVKDGYYRWLSRYYFVLFIIAACGQLLHFPPREPVLHATYKASTF